MNVENKNYNEFIKYSFSQNLKNLRKNKNISISQLAKKLNKSNASITRYQAGICVPDFYTLFVLAEALEVTIDDLLKPVKIK